MVKPLISTHPEPSNGALFLFATTSVAFAIAIGLGGPYLLKTELRDYAEIIQTLPPMFTRSTVAGSMIATPLCGLVFFQLSFMMFYRLISGKSPPQNIGRILVQCLSIVAIVALISLFVARFLFNSYWVNEFQRANYHRCPSSFFLTSQWFSDALVLDPLYCMDKTVRAMMTSTEFNIEDINNYLREKE